MRRGSHSRSWDVFPGAGVRPTKKFVLSHRSTRTHGKAELKGGGNRGLIEKQCKSKAEDVCIRLKICNLLIQNEVHGGGQRVGC